ncbi:MAG: phenylalanine--tRNA ligase subunit beta [Bacillota bacterium]|jgi:phenylalanyl-tRNA synthetase beta chain
MRVSYKWLQDYVDLDITPQELADKLTMAGIEVDEIEYIGEGVSGVVVAQVMEKNPHPNSKKLSICQVDNGDKTVTVVCGAPNVDIGQKVALANPGATLPAGIEIKPTKVAGVESVGMICSAAELGLDEHDNAGIMVLPEDLNLGQDVIEALNIKDAVLILELTPNRSDCLGMLNVAKEAAAITGSFLQPQFIQYPEKGPDINSLTSVNVEDVDLCPRYVVRLVQGVTIEPSPLWMQHYLLAAGMRPVNNIVDISNFVMLETGQPLHTFDYQTLSGHRIIVRRSHTGEKMVTLDEKERTFDDKTILICDAEKPICIGGVMGGMETEVTEKTVDVLIEAAAFNAASIRRTARGLGIPSEASLRFEKGIDIEACDRAAKRAAQLLVQLCGGTAARGFIDTRKDKSIEKTITLRPQKITEILGIEYSLQDIAKVMTDLAFCVENHGNGLLVTVPHYRQDITMEVDLIEEVARLKGYENIPAVLPNGSASLGKRTAQQQNLVDLHNLLAGLGLSQVVNYSFVSSKEVDRLLLPEKHAWRDQLPIMNPLSEEQAVMRTSLLAGLLHTVTRNYNRRNLNLALFEIAERFYPRDVGEQPLEVPALGIVLLGSTPLSWQGTSSTFDYFYLKGLVERVLDFFAITDYQFTPADEQEYPFLHPGCSAVLSLGERLVGYLGELHPLVAKNYDLEEERLLVCEMDLAVLQTAASADKYCRPLPKFPAVMRDIAVLGDASIPVAEITATIYAQGGKYLEKAELFDLYDQEPIPVGQRSLAYALTFQDYEKTLTDAEVDAAFNQIVKALGDKWDLRLR